MIIDTNPNNLWLPGMDESMLFVPEEVEDLLCVSTDSEATAHESKQAFLVNWSSDALLDGSLDIETYMDIVESTGLDPEFHLQRAVWVVSNFL